MNTVKERVDEISRNDNLSLQTQPTTAKIELTGRCTLNCSFCEHGEMCRRNERQSLITEDEFQMAYDYVKSFSSMKEIGLFYMGESSLHPKLAQFYKQVHDDGYFTFLTTNGTITKNIIPAIPYIDSLKVSYNYKSSHDFELKTRCSSYLLTKIHRNICTLADVCHAYGKKLAVSVVLDSEKEDYCSTGMMLEELGVDERYFIPLQNQGGTQEKGAGGVIGEADNPVSPMPCWSLFKGIYIDCELNVRTCCYGHGKEHILGNLKDGPVSLEQKRKYMCQHLNGEIPKVCTQCIKTPAFVS